MLSRTQTYYDGSTTLGALPAKGKVTRSREQVDAATWNVVDSTYHPDGRLSTTTDGNGHTSTTTYQGSTATPVAPLLDPGYPVTTTTTNEAGHVSTVRHSAKWGGPDREVDPNGRVTTLAYDGFGRLISVKEPSESASGAPESWRFTYYVSGNKSAAPSVLSEQLRRKTPSAQYIKSWTIYDGFGRERQVQATSPATATNELIVTTTSYNDRGRVSGHTAPQDIAGTGGTRYTYTVNNRTALTYDALGRTTKEAWFRTGSTEAWSTSTAYTYDTTTVTPPGAGATATKVDGLGRPVQVNEHDGPTVRITNYAYATIAGGGTRVTVTDPAGNVTTSDSNMAGWVTAQHDPNRGARTFGYDDVGNVVRTTDALGNQVHTVLDGLDRPVERRSGSATGPLLASWTYDKAGQLGLLDKSVRHTAQGAWTTEVTGYDARNRVLGTKLSLPGINGLASSYTTTQTYDETDAVTSVTHPAIGGLLQETVTTAYDPLGYADTLTGSNAYADDDYVWATGRDDIGRPLLYGYGPRPGGNTWLGKLWTYNSDQRLQRVQTSVSGAGNVSDQQLAYDEVGNVTERLRDRSGAVTRECFDYDDRNRLKTAYTVAGTCSPAQAGTGAEPYSASYSYMANGSIDARVEDGVTTDYAYSASGPTAVRPHAPNQVGADTYQWDPNGNLSSRTVGGVAETFAWDVEQRLVAIDGPGSDDASFVYDAGGQRLLRREGDLTTVYVGSHEVTVNGAGSVVRAVRSYTFEGQLVATRTPSGADYVVTNDQGSVEMTLPSGGTPAGARAFRPFGEQYETSGASFDSDQGWIGQIEDAGSNLSYLNARYYDADTGLFISPDPVVDLGDPRMGTPYTYGFNNPTTLTDPTGMKPSNEQLQHRVNVLEHRVDKLLGVIGDLRRIIRQQNNTIAGMQDVIFAQRNRIADQKRVIGKLQGTVKHQQGVIKQQGGVIRAMRQTIRSQNQRILALYAVVRGQQAIIRGQKFLLAFQAAFIGRLVAERAQTPGPTGGRSTGGNGAVVLAGIGSNSRAACCDPSWDDIPGHGVANDMGDWLEDQGEAWTCNIVTGGSRPCGDIDDPGEAIVTEWMDPPAEYCAVLTFAGAANGAASYANGGAWVTRAGSLPVFVAINAIGGGCWIQATQVLID
jgi:RHS repeat-associated protein